MNKLEECLSIYQSMMHSRFELILENNLVLSFHFDKGNLCHLLGLQKLKDIPQLQRSTGTQVYKMLLDESLSYRTLRKSKYYTQIQNRFECFHLLPMLPYGKVIVNFDRQKVGETELINTKYILYRQVPNGVIHLTFGEKGLTQYPETFFFDPRKRYIDGQELLDVLELKVHTL